MSDQTNKPDSIYNIDEETDSSFEQVYHDLRIQILETTYPNNQ